MSAATDHNDRVEPARPILEHRHLAEVVPLAHRAQEDGRLPAAAGVIHMRVPAGTGEKKATDKSFGECSLSRADSSRH